MIKQQVATKAICPYGIGYLLLERIRQQEIFLVILSFFWPEIA